MNDLKNEWGKLPLAVKAAFIFLTLMYITVWIFVTPLAIIATIVVGVFGSAFTIISHFANIGN